MNPSATDLIGKGFIEMPDGSFRKPSKILSGEPALLRNSEIGAVVTHVCASNPDDIGGLSTAEATKNFIIKTTPVPAPRMTRRDKWLQPRRPAVQRYFDYRDVLQRAVGDLPIVPDHIAAVFYLPMPESWSKKKRIAMNGKPHKQKPDRDNLDKAVCDSLFLQDCGVWSGEQRKYWCFSGQERVELTLRYDPA